MQSFTTKSKFMQYLEILSQKIKYSGSFVSADALFTLLFPNTKSYQLEQLKAIEGIETMELEGELLYPIEAIAQRLLVYQPQKSSVLKNPQSFANYLKVQNSGGVNYLAEQIGIDQRFDVRDVSDIIDAVDKNLLSDCAEIQQEYEGIIANLKAEVLELSTQKEAIESEAQSSKSLVISLTDQLQSAAKEIGDLQAIAKKYDAEIIAKEKAKSSWLKNILTDPKIMLWATILAIVVFLPFTVLNLKQYIDIPTSNFIEASGLWLLCCFIAATWDFSILVFAVNGKRNLAVLGSCFQFIFISSKFNFFRSYIELIGYNGETFQKMVVITAIVIYSPVLVYQFAELAVKMGGREK
jgi:hypothetical protein